MGFPLFPPSGLFIFIQTESYTKLLLLLNTSFKTVYDEKIISLFIVLPVGWSPYRPGHSCTDIRDSGYSKGDGEYWIDFEEGVNPLKVYCDLTTDGGKL